MTEQWVPWTPTEHLAQKYHLYKITDILDHFTLFLVHSTNKNQKVNVIFPHSVHASRYTNIRFRQKTLNLIEQQHSAKFYNEWSFFKVYNSAYFKWLSKDSYEWFDVFHCTHFAFIFDQVIIDIATDYEPIVEHVS